MSQANCTFSRLSKQLPVIVSMICAAPGCSRQKSPDSAIIRPVKTMVVVAGDELRMRSFPGRVEASKQAELAFQVPGLVIDVPVLEGQSVAHGALIAQLRQDEFRARLTALQGQLDQARAALTALQSGERPEERLRREAQVRAAEAELNNARTESNRFAQVAKSNPNAIA